MEGKTEVKLSRKNFLRKSAIGLTGLSFANGLFPVVGKTNNGPLAINKENMISGDTYKIKNVRLETGFEYENGEVVGTKTKLFTVEIASGKIKQVHRNQPQGEGVDGNGLLMLPAFKDMHIHLDKTLYTERWRAVRRIGGVKEIIELEQRTMRDLLKNSTYKAEKLIELLQSFGSSFARSHVNIEPTSKLDALKNLEQALANKKDTFGAELVAFPQHGLYYTESLPYMEEAAKMNIDYIGALDPYTIDGAIERTMDTTIRLALDHHKGIDMHLHEAGGSGIRTIEYLIAKVLENPVLKSKTFVSHAFALGAISKGKQEELAEQLAEAQIGIVSTVPFGNLVMPIPILMEKGVQVTVGNDSIVDYWSTMGTGSVLQKANLAAQLYGYTSEFGLSRMLKLATAGATPLDDKGAIQWPKVGDEASIVLIDASCSAEAVSRISPVKSLVYKGNKVY
ncbi:MAG TPA: deaminase [Candidatus Sphingobacterium stercoripullorum]|uniref:Deaminase n=1 Tax=Candidatus Sphingobacterium stercoripullorum TaxID=2838759 RepID=A0A9D2AXE8_9SPHI|nr:deaminase [Candidatus Sphingobacterium stercoripullorum]